MRLRFKALAVSLLVGGVVLGTATMAAANPVPGNVGHSSARPASGTPAVKNYKNAFTKNTSGWCTFGGCDGLSGDDGTITQTKSGTSTNAYAPGLDAQSGHWYATVTGATDTTSGCATYPSEDESCNGPYTDWGNANNDYFTFPKNGFTTSLDIYLDTTWAAANPSAEFEWDTAVNQSDGNYGQDFIFTVQSGASGFTIGTGNNTDSSVPAPSVTIGTSGWYRFVHDFTVNPSTGDVQATLSVIDDATATEVPGANWVIPVIFGGQPEPPINVGGPLLGWFPNENILGLPIDNSILKKN